LRRAVIAAGLFARYQSACAIAWYILFCAVVNLA
jgi:hypothetical protein